jgi:hypothetical protein
LLEDQIRLAPSLELAQKWNKGSDNHNHLAGANAGSVKGVDADLQVDIRMRAALPA